MTPDEAPIVVPALYDFASTIAYVAHRVLGAMEDELRGLGIALDWRPVDLARILGIPRGAAIPAERRANALRVARDLGVAVRAPSVWLDSRRAHAALLLLHRDPRAPALRERIWSAVFEEGRDPGTPGEVEALAADLGLALDAGALARAEDELELRTAVAEEDGVTGVPTLMLDGWPLGGIQTPETMRLLLSRWARRRRARAPAS